MPQLDESGERKTCFSEKKFRMQPYKVAVLENGRCSGGPDFGSLGISVIKAVCGSRFGAFAQNHPYI